MNPQIEALLAKKPWTVTASAVMKRFAELLTASWTAKLAKAEPIVFELGIETWTLDPKDQRDFVRPGDNAAARLRISCTPAALQDLLTDPHYQYDPYRIVAIGDLAVLQPVIDALRSNQSPLALRASLSSRKA